MAMLNNQMVIFRHTQIICIYYTVYIYICDVCVWREYSPHRSRNSHHGLPLEPSQKCYPIYVDKTHSNLRGSKNGVYKYVVKRDILNSININTREPMDFSHPPFFLPESSLPLNFVYKHHRSEIPMKPWICWWDSYINHRKKGGMHNVRNS
jgi:hypothetical protein